MRKLRFNKCRAGPRRYMEAALPSTDEGTQSDDLRLSKMQLFHDIGSYINMITTKKFHHGLNLLLCFRFQVMQHEFAELFIQQHTTPFRLMDLPPELREMIFSFALPTCRPKTIWMKTDRDGTSRTNFPKEPVLALVSRQVRTEALYLFYSRITFKLISYSMPYYYDQDLGSFIRYCRRIGRERAGMVKLILVEDTWTDQFIPKLAQFYVDRYSENDMSRTLTVARTFRQHGIDLERIKVTQSHRGGNFWDRRRQLWQDAIAQVQTEEVTDYSIKLY